MDASNNTISALKEHRWIRFVWPVLATLLLFTVTIFWIILPYMESRFILFKKEMLRELTGTAVEVLAYYYDQEEKGVLPVAEAQARAIEILRKIRYGPEKKDYFWINDKTPRMIMHPYRKDLVGKDLTHFVDVNEKHLFLEFVKVVEDKGQGYVDYMWQWKDDPKRIVPKISFVREFAPWQWIVGTGIYIDDVHREIASVNRKIIFVAVLITTLVIALSALSIRAGLRSDKERRNAWISLKESEEQHRAMLASSPNPIVLYDKNGYVRYLNPAFTNTFGWQASELIGKKVDYVPKANMPETQMAITEAYRLDGKRYTFESRRVAKDGTALDVQINAAVYKNAKGRADGMVVNLEDITMRKRLEAHLRQSQKMEALGTLSSGISHDFKNILLAIAGYTEMSLDDVGPETDTADNLRCILQATDRARKLINQILTFSRQSAIDRRPLLLKEIVAEVLTLILPSLPKNITVNQVLASGSLIDGDATQIHQVMMNLCANAVQAMPDGGELSVDVIDIVVPPEGLPEESPELKAGHYVRLVVKDNGNGIPLELLDRIFDPFFTTKAEGQGTGMGLSVVHGIVKQHDGCVSVKSSPGRGSEFHIYFPKLLKRGGPYGDSNDFPSDGQPRG